MNRNIELLVSIGVLATVGAARADVIRTVGPDPRTGPPYYTDAGRLGDGTGAPYFFHDDQWAAFVFLRLPTCVPLDFNLLDNLDVPRVFDCGLTVGGHAIWTNAASGPQDIPIQVSVKGLGAVPVWFVRLSEVQAILTGNTLTVRQLLASPSLRQGLANVYDEVDLPGPNRPQGAGNGSTHVVASGLLQSGMSFQLEWLDMGVKDGGGADFIRLARIAFK